MRSAVCWRRFAVPFAHLGRKGANFLAQPFFVQAWFLPTWLLLGVSKTLIFSISFRRLAKHLGRRSGVAPEIPPLTPKQELRATEVGRAVRLAARYTPWNSNCFPRAVTARVLLGIYGIPYGLYFGMTKNPSSSEVEAHAWVLAGGVCVTGAVSDGFTVVECFVGGAGVRRV